MKELHKIAKPRYRPTECRSDEDKIGLCFAGIIEKNYCDDSVGNFLKINIEQKA